MQSILSSDLDFLYFDYIRYNGRVEMIDLFTIDGVINRRTVELELCVMRDREEKLPLTTWFPVVCAIDDSDDANGTGRVSGHEMYHYAYFGISPHGQDMLVIANTRNALNQHIP